MKTAVRYFSRTGNTCALAYAMSQAVNAEAKDIKCDLEGETDVLFLGSSLYAGNYDASVGEFLEKNADNPLIFEYPRSERPVTDDGRRFFDS